MILAAATLLSMPASLHAQDYSFEVPRNISTVRIDSRGRAELSYRLTFACNPGARAIDIVDIGMPNGSYQLEAATAAIRGHALTDIRVSEYVKPYGVEVHLGDDAIAPGDSATLSFSIPIDRVLNLDSRDTGYASFRFTPTWYGSDYVTGITRLECTFIFPMGVQPGEPRYHEVAFTEAWFDSAFHAAVYRWVVDPASPDGQYAFGASFPARYVPAGSITRPPPLAVRVFSAVGGFFWAIIKFLLSNWVFALVGLIIFFIARQSRARRMQYLPPQLSIEGVGIKRGLAAPEAAILLEVPLEKVLTMVLFGLVRKGALEVTQREPKLLAKPLDAAKAEYAYETKFLAAIGENGELGQPQLQTMAIDLIKSVNDKMKGFSRKESVKYYRGIVDQAWEQVKVAGTPELKSQGIAENYDWMIMDRDYRDKVNEHYRGGAVVLPSWWWPMGYGHGHAEQAPAGAGPSVQMPKLPGADFANSIVTSTEKFAAGLVGGGGADKFARVVTAITNPVPVSSSSSSSSGGGHSSCACACACAGCACACAGGGR
jgi:hypothetical protein